MCKGELIRQFYPSRDKGMARSLTQRCIFTLLAILVLLLMRNNTPHSPNTLKSQETFYPIPQWPNRQPIVDQTVYHSLVEEAEHDWQSFWLHQAKKRLTWYKPPEKSFHGDFSEGQISWFADGELNVAFNCVDRHAISTPEKIAIIWEGDEPGDNRRISYRELLSLVSQVSNYLISKGVKQGDTVAIYMPMVPETVVAMLACARIGALHNVVFAGFSADSLADRIIDSKARIVFTADEGIRGNKHIPLKITTDEALIKCPSVHTVLIYKRTGSPIPIKSGRDEFWNDVIPTFSTECIPIHLPAEQPLFMLYTSGSTGKPKGIVHTSAGYLLYASITHQLVFDYQNGDIYGCLADVGWITGHTYIVYGPLANGATTIVFESLPTYPDPSRYWNLVQRLNITQLYTAPTVIRALKKFGNSPLNGHDLSSLRVLGTVGEPINPDAWLWYYEHVGKGRCAVVDTYWQTETGGHILTPLPGAVPTKAGSACLPFLGINVVVLDQHNGKVINGEEADGVLTIARPWPGMARTIFGDHSKYVNTYFRPYPGYYFSGDRVYRDPDGYYWIRGRVDDVINVSGHRLSTAELEAALGKHPLCTEAAVLGRPDEITGQSIWAFCILRPEAKGLDPKLLESDLKNTVRHIIGAFSVPRRVILVEDLPKTRSGKIMRRIIRKILEGITDVRELGDISTLNNPDVVQELIEAVRL